MILVYLATPYSHPDRNIVLTRVGIVNMIAAQYMRSGIFVFSPISHTHTIAEAGGLPTDWHFWQEYDRIMITACTELHVLMLPGWDRSTGVKSEIEIAKRLNKPISYISVDI